MSQLPETIDAQLKYLLDPWVESLTQVLESMTDQKPEVRWDSGITLAADPDTLWWEQPFHIAPDAPVWVAAPRETWEHAGTITLKAAGLETIETTEARNTWLEILGQSLSGMARSIGLVVGREVRCEGGKEREPVSMPETGAAVSIKIGETALAPLWIAVSPKLLTALFSPPAEDDRHADAADSAPASGAEVAKRPTAPPTMDLLLDVELPVSISFGKTQLQMKDVLKLTTGSIVELNRGVNESVEVMVNHCLIARGEVVVVEGNYGVRIQQIASRNDRIRSFR
jgi:flagellar motor switch protein FliN/FliY